MKLLIPVDGSDVSLQAVHHALSLVGLGLRAELVLANVQEPATVYEMVTLHDREALERVADAAGRDMLAPAAAAVRAAGVPFVEEVVTGDPVPMLLEVLEAHGCHAVVMGSQGKGWVGAWLGSVSQAMLEHSPVPVTVVKPAEPQEPVDDIDA
jgi:nucleotide-binding universal stress UspA family protein